MHMQTKDDGTWHISSISGLNPDGYSIKLLSEICKECVNSPTALTCVESECQQLCYHMYKCDDQCYDYSNGHICKHIHCVHSMRVGESSHNDITNYGPSGSESESCSAPLTYPEAKRDTPGIMVLITHTHKVYYL